MTNFRYTDNLLYYNDLCLFDIAKKYSTPFYCYFGNHIENQFNAIKNLFNFKPTLIAYALKANSNRSLINVLSKLGAGADTVSGWEIRKALDSGILSKNIVFSGVGKSHEEITYSLEKNIKQINVESISELRLINNIAKNLGMIAPISLRVNPEIDVGTHKNIITGDENSKFGIIFEEAKNLLVSLNQFSSLAFMGFSIHIGSQINSIKPFKLAFSKLLELVNFTSKLGIEIKTLDFGGGIGISYNDADTINIPDYAKLIKDLTHTLNIKIILEPGRFLIGNSGIIIAKVQYIKTTKNKKFLILNTGMNDFIRISLYEAYHKILPLEINDEHQDYYDIVGPVCESSDFFAHNRELNRVREGDLVAILGTGAYGYSMSSNYNLRPKLAEVLLQNGKDVLIRKQETYEDYSQLEIVDGLT
ncbi:diaminopimelate decarboxylase [Reticulomyxa filosa]|uniref:Diaminopimelate decarboxylase n=1 Tax=Reticulomyxa filosa TaxID=46433 RepID=X6N5X1_RETFI|nr:diaminopimelate decarboxylase [Reticulomyxa filosa]|eukprot:ETO21159.1 diaminopimelate decarboxylase [Reticulomyxa filosa]